MTRKWKPLAALALVGVVASPADAEWQGTKWGMTEQQIGSSGAPTRYKIGTYDFNVTYEYENHRLVQITLDLISAPLCEGLISDVSTKYGQPAGIDRPIPDITKFKWSDPASGNMIEISQFPSKCFLLYKEPMKGL